jgi:hypothetical protein
MAQMPQLQLIKPTEIQCSACGAISTAACGCGAPYIPAFKRAAKAITEAPKKSDRAIAAEIGVNRRTVVKARNQLAQSAPVEEKRLPGKDFPVDTRVGRDGKVRHLPKKKKSIPEIRFGRDGKTYPSKYSKKPIVYEIPTQEEADESLQNDLYKIALEIVDDEMSGETRQKFFAHLERTYNGTITQSSEQRAAKGLPA